MQINISDAQKGKRGGGGWGGGEGVEEKLLYAIKLKRK